MTRLSDRKDAVPDEVWNGVSKHFDEQGMVTLLLQISVVNLFRCLNLPARLIAGGE